jgi:hypothetical protein
LADLREAHQVGEGQRIEVSYRQACRFEDVDVRSTHGLCRGNERRRLNRSEGDRPLQCGLAASAARAASSGNVAVASWRVS